jgi:DNA polymerase-3 subunit delta
VILTGLEANAAADADLLRYIAYPNPETCVVITHAGGVRGKKVLDALADAKTPVIECETMKRDSDKASFIIQILKNKGAKAAPEAVTALIEAAGQDLRNLASAATQIAEDVKGLISAESVHVYLGGRVEATSFKIADAAMAGDATLALSLFRHGLAMGIKGPELTGAMATKLRALAKAAAVRTGEAGARELGLQDWQLRNAYQDLRKWRPEHLAAAAQTIARADYVVKGGGGGGVNTEYELEKAVLDIALRK